MQSVHRSLFAIVFVVGLWTWSIKAADGAEPIPPGNTSKVDTPLVEAFLHAGDLARGEAALNLAIDTEPENSHLKFQLGLLLVFRATERLGQSLYEHGARSSLQSMPLLRLPVPQNPNPSPISYRILRSILQQAADDLAKAEAVLAQVQDESVVLPLRLAAVKLNLDGDGKPTDMLLDILKQLLRENRFPSLDGNPEFLVKFDRGDVAWLRAYCHLLMSAADLMLAFDLRDEFYRYAAAGFASSTGSPNPMPPQPVFPDHVLRIIEPARLQSFRQHMVRVCELNDETWRFIRAENDDDYEWLPNPKQAGVLKLPVTDEMIDAWLGAVHEYHAMLKGEKLIPYIFANDGINLRKALSDPPTEFNVRRFIEAKMNAKYRQPLNERNAMDLGSFLRVMRVFDGPLGVAYAAWFN